MFTSIASFWVLRSLRYCHGISIHDRNQQFLFINNGSQCQTDIKRCYPILFHLEVRGNEKLSAELIIENENLQMELAII